MNDTRAARKVKCQKCGKIQPFAEPCECGSASFFDIDTEKKAKTWVDTWKPADPRDTDSYGKHAYKAGYEAARLAERRELLEWVIAWGQSEMKVYFDDHEYHMSPRYEDALASELIDALKSKLEAK